MEYEIIFKSERINFIKLTEKLVQDYLDMVNDIEVQKFISHNRKTYELDRELEWIKSKLEENAIKFYDKKGYHSRMYTNIKKNKIMDMLINIEKFI